jgi:hypothetical protein
MTRHTHRTGRAPIRATLSNGQIVAHVERPSNARSRRAGIWLAWVLLALVALAVAVVVAASRPASALSCWPEPCSGVGEPPMPMPMPPLGGCPPGAILMCPRAALPVVTR